MVKKRIHHWPQGRQRRHGRLVIFLLQGLAGLFRGITQCGKKRLFLGLHKKRRVRRAGDGRAVPFLFNAHYAGCPLGPGQQLCSVRGCKKRFQRPHPVGDGHQIVRFR